MSNILLKLRKNLTAAADRSISLALATVSILGQPPSACYDLNFVVQFILLLGLVNFMHVLPNKSKLYGVVYIRVIKK